MFSEHGRGDMPSMLGGSPAGDHNGRPYGYTYKYRHIKLVFSADLCYNGGTS